MSCNRSLIQLKNIGTKLALRLNSVGIHTEADLRAVGAVAAHHRIKQQYPDEMLPVCYYLYAFEGALTDTHWNDISEQRKQALKTQIK